MSSESAGVLDRVLLWSPDVQPADFGAAPRSGLRIACIVGDRLFEGLSQEAELLLLTRASWEELLRFGRADLLLVESTWFPCTGDWHMAQSVAGPEQEELRAVVALARSLGIPTVFWMTLDSQYLHLYQQFAGQFDQVFCADPKAVEGLMRHGIEALPLGPAIQPRRFNPIRAFGERDFAPGVVYDGWADLHKFQEVRAALGRLGTRPLSIIDTSAMIARHQVRRIQEPGLRSAIRGWVHPDLLPEVYKRADAYVSFSRTAATPTLAAWRLMEAAACRVPTIHLGELEEDDPRRRFTRHWTDPGEFVADIAGLTEAGLSRELAVHATWRDLHANHCFAERLAAICRALGLEHDWRPFPKATMVTGTMRPHLLEKCVSQFLSQTYPNKELVVVFNGPSSAVDEISARYAARHDITFTAVPTDHFAGSLLNFGARLASGEYFFRVDDDDHYGENYLYDAMLHLRACDAEVLGKRGSFFHFEGESHLYLRKNFLPEIACFPARELHRTDATLISGCSFGCRLDLLEAVLYPDDVNLSADTELVERIRSARPDSRCLMLDSLNLVVERSRDVGKHTWQQPAEQLKDEGQALEASVGEILV